MKKRTVFLYGLLIGSYGMVFMIDKTPVQSMFSFVLGTLALVSALWFILYVNDNEDKVPIVNKKRTGRKG